MGGWSPEVLGQEEREKGTGGERKADLARPRKRVFQGYNEALQGLKHVWT
jgi:hypothetical protein